jgi:hypothetical protein
VLHPRVQQVGPERKKEKKRYQGTLDNVVKTPSIAFETVLSRDRL